MKLDSSYRPKVDVKNIIDNFLSHFFAARFYNVSENALISPKGLVESGIKTRFFFFSPLDPFAFQKVIPCGTLGGTK